jgi:hypothetical protein
MKNDFPDIWKEAVKAYIEIIQKDNPTRIRTRYLRNSSPERQQYNNAFSETSPNDIWYDIYLTATG